MSAIEVFAAKKMMSASGKLAKQVIIKACIAYKEHQLEQFLKNIDMRYEALNTENQAEFVAVVESYKGKELLAKFAETVITTNSERATMALALLYCNDLDNPLDELERYIFVRAMKGIDDDQIDFFLKAVDVEVVSHSDPSLPYERTGISSNNVGDFDFHDWGAEGVHVFINDLINKRLLLPDPSTAPATASEPGWAVWYGVTEKSKKFASLLRKAALVLGD